MANRQDKAGGQVGRQGKTNSLWKAGRLRHVGKGQAGNQNKARQNKQDRVRQSGYCK
jgi:hypothetical protein